MEARPGWSGSGIDYDALVKIFIDLTPDTPSGLVEGIHLVHQMAMPSQMDRLVKEAIDIGITLDLAEDATAEDVAIKMLMVDPGLLEDLPNQLLARKHVNDILQSRYANWRFDNLKLAFFPE